MAYILLKINDINSAQLLLNKANDYNRSSEEKLKIKSKTGIKIFVFTNTYKF